MDSKKAAKKLAKKREVEKWDRVIARVLKATREDVDLTQDELAAELGWTRNQVANAESGRRTVRASEFPLFAAAFKMDREAIWRRIMRWPV